MTQEEKKISQTLALKQINQALKRTALLYHYFAETLVDQLGETAGIDLVEKAIAAYGAHIGRASKKTAEDKGLSLLPENFQDDLPDLAWEWEAVQVEDEERVRVYHCPLASEWLDWGDARKARLYCHVDQAKMFGFNPDYEYVHIKNILDGDPYCELAVRPVNKHKDEKNEKTPENIDQETVWSLNKCYTKNDLMKMDPVCLRALFRERVHHTVEVNLYPVILGEKKASPNLWHQPQLILEVWRERGFPDDDPDLKWGKTYLEMAVKLQNGEDVALDTNIPEPFTEDELQVVNKLIWERRSIRDFIPGKAIPENKIEKILEAGRAAPTGCNLDIVRFIVIREEKEAKMIWSDIPTPMDRCVLIVICYDKRIYKTIGHDKLVGHNQILDAAAAADHMCLMAHALGLGGVWLTCTAETARKFKEKYGLPDFIEQVCHMAVGWPVIGPIKSQRMPLKEMVITHTSNSSPDRP